MKRLATISVVLPVLCVAACGGGTSHAARHTVTVIQEPAPQDVTVDATPIAASPTTTSYAYPSSISSEPVASTQQSPQTVIRNTQNRSSGTSALYASDDGSAFERAVASTGNYTSDQLTEIYLYMGFGCAMRDATPQIAAQWTPAGLAQDIYHNYQFRITRDTANLLYNSC